MSREWAEKSWEQRLAYLRQAAHAWHSNSPVTVEDYDGDWEAYAGEMIDEFKTEYVLAEAETRYVTARIRGLVGIEE